MSISHMACMYPTHLPRVFLEIVLSTSTIFPYLQLIITHQLVKSCPAHVHKQSLSRQIRNIFNKKLTIAYNKSFPFVKLFRKRSKDKPWIATGLKQSIKQKHLLYQKYINDSTEVNNQIYKIFKNKLRTLIRKAEADHCKESFNYKTQSMKQMWRELGNLINTNKKKFRLIQSVELSLITKFYVMTRILQMHLINISGKLVKILLTKLYLRNHIFTQCI